MIATSNCNAAKDLVSLFANGEHVTALRLELLPGAAVRATIEKVVTVEELTRFLDRDQGVRIEGEELT